MENEPKKIRLKYISKYVFGAILILVLLIIIIASLSVKRDKEVLPSSPVQGEVTEKQISNTADSVSVETGINAKQQEMQKVKKESEIVSAKTKQEIDEDAEVKAYKEKLQREYKEEREKLVNSGTKAGNFCKENPTWTIGECNQVSWGDVWVGMNRDMLRASRGYPDYTNKSNYGNGETTQECWTDKTPMCVYVGSDGIVTAYN